MKKRPALCAACYLCLCVIPLWSEAKPGVFENTIQKVSDQNTKNEKIFFSQYIERELANNPALLIAKAAIETAKLSVIGRSKPVFNPELIIEAENTDINTYQLGINQTIDWHDVRGTNREQANTLLKFAKVDYFATRERITGGLLLALVNYLSRRDAGLLAKKHVLLMQQFVKLAESRQGAGDINQIDIDTAKLALAEAVMLHSDASSQLLTAQNGLMSITGRPIDKSFPFPSYLPSVKETDLDIENIVSHHPKVVLAQLQVEAAKSQVRLVDLGRRANPTIGLSAGKEDDETLVSVSFSMPLMVRNTFNSKVAVARQSTFQAGQLVESAHRQVTANIISAKKRYRVMAKAWELWQKNGKETLSSHQKILEKLWQSGELSASQYLFQLKQSLDTQIVGSKLQGNVWEAWLDCVIATASVNTWLTTVDEEQK